MSKLPFLLNFVYEVWQAPYYEFYGSPSLADKIKDLTHCSFADGVIILFCSWVVSALVQIAELGTLSQLEADVSVYQY